MTQDELIDALNDEADLCRNEGADDIAELLCRAVNRIAALKAELVEQTENNNTLRQLYRSVAHDVIELERKIRGGEKL